MNTDYLPPFQISFSGFTATQQQRLEMRINEDMHLLVAAEPVYEKSERTIVAVYFLKNICDIDKVFFEKLKSSNERTICVADFDDFESLLSCVRTGCYACVASSNIMEELVPAITFALQNRTYISGVFASVIHQYFKNNTDSTRYAALFTNREHKLVQLLTAGALYKEIAWKLRISENTVRSHVRNIYSKLKVHSKTELAQKIFNGNLVTSSIYFVSDYLACLCY